MVQPVHCEYELKISSSILAHVMHAQASKEIKILEDNNDAHDKFYDNYDKISFHIMASPFPFNNWISHSSWAFSLAHVAAVDPLISTTPFKEMTFFAYT